MSRDLDTRPRVRYHDDMTCSPDYTTHIETPVRGDGTLASTGRDEVIFACTCGEETCTWQVTIHNQRNFR